MLLPLNIVFSWCIINYINTPSGAIHGIRRFVRRGWSSPEPAESVVSKQHQADDISTNDSYTDDTMDQVMKEQSDVMTAHATNGKFYTTGAGAAVATAYQDTTEHTLFDKVGTSDFND